MRQYLIVNIRDSYVGRSLTTLLTLLLGEGARVTPYGMCDINCRPSSFGCYSKVMTFLNLGDDAIQTITFDDLLIFT